MNPPVHLYALYGPGQSWTLTLTDDGRYRFTLGGNAAPLLPACEMGAWEGGPDPDVHSLRAQAVAALTQCESNAPSRPDSAFVHADAGPDLPTREYALYAPPPPWALVQDRALARMNGRWATSRARTVAARAAWETTSAREGDAFVSALAALSATGAQAAVVSEPARAERWSVSLLPLGLSPEAEERYPWELAPEEFRVDRATGVAAGDTVRLAPGDSVTVRLTMLRALGPGNYRCVLRYSSDVNPRRGGIEGALTVEAGVLTVTPRR